MVNEGDEVWVAGKEFKELTMRYGASVKVIGNELPDGQAQVVFLEHVAPDGSMIDLFSLVKKIRDRCPDALIITDLSTSFGADIIDFSSLDIDGCVIVPERALGGIPGISVLAFRESVREHIRKTRETAETIPYSFDILKYDKAWEKHSTPYSPNISSSVALAASIELIDRNGGFEKHLERQRLQARIVRNGMRALGATCTEGGTNAFTVFSLPCDSSGFVSALEEEGVGIEQCGTDIRIGHAGHLREEDFSRLFRVANNMLSGETSPFSLDPLDEPDAWEPSFRKLFSINPEELIEEARKTTEGKNSLYAGKIVSSACRAFQTHQNYDLYGCFKTRTVGFIGAGNTVKEAAALCKRVGIERVLVYSPSLAKLTVRGTDFDNHKTLEYWESRDIEVVPSKEKLLLEAHTVVLLPTFHTKESISLLGKSLDYINEKMIDEKLLTGIRDAGKMDLLINASAREGLIDRKALARHLEEGWLVYMGDELPPEDDPVLQQSEAYLTGHIAGSSKLTKQRIAQNTRALLEKVILQLRTGSPLDRTNGYVVNVLNEHLRPKSGWRSESGSIQEVRILLTDLFDIQTLDFPGLERSGDIRIVIKDISSSFPSEETLIKEITDFRPHILMIRTRTTVTRQVAHAVETIHELSFLIRPGVGIDNAYEAIAPLSDAGVQIVNEPYGNSFSVGEITAHMILNGITKTLLAPGPTQIKPEVFKVMSNYAHPGMRVFSETRKEIHRRLQGWMDRDEHQVLMTATPSTGFMEATITNLTKRGERGFVIAHGKFGNRFIEIAEATGRIVDSLTVSDEQWGHGFSPEEVANALSGGAYTFLCFQQNETSSGVAYTEEQVRSIVTVARAHNPDIIIVMDGVSGIGAHDLSFKTIDIDAIVLGSQKALGVSSGITYLSLSPRAISRMFAVAGYTKNLDSFRKEPDRSAYLDTFEIQQRVRYISLLRLIAGEGVGAPAIFHELSILASLRLMDEEGGKGAVVTRHEKLAVYAREAVTRMKLETLSRDPYFSNSVTPLLVPKNKDATMVRKALQEQYGFSVAGSQCEYWKKRLIRIGHVGYVSFNDVVRCLRGLRILLRD